MENHQERDPVTGKIMGMNRLSWIVHRGDLALSSYLECHETMLAFNFRERDERKSTISVYKYLEDDDYLPARVRVKDKGKCALVRK
jgi:hypothetical protein